MSPSRRPSLILAFSWTRQNSLDTSVGQVLAPTNAHLSVSKDVPNHGRQGFCVSHDFEFGQGKERHVGTRDLGCVSCFFVPVRFDPVCVIHHPGRRLIGPSVSLSVQP